MTLNDALDKTHCAARPVWNGDKAVWAVGGMLLLCSFAKDVTAEWADELGFAITDAINADDYEPAEFKMESLVRYRVVGQAFAGMSG